MARGSSQYLYRIISFDRLVQMIETSEWHFSHPSRWEDPYEVLIRNSLSYATYAQCWCRHGSSDAMWRIYSPDRLGVRIRTEATLLGQALYESDGFKRSEHGFRISRVKYVNPLEYVLSTKRIEADLAKRVTFTRASAHMFLKRSAFSHEAETRVVLIDFNQAEGTKRDALRIKLDTRALIGSVLVDPRAPDAYVEAYKYYLKNRLGFKGPVSKSALYRSVGGVEP